MRRIINAALRLARQNGGGVPGAPALGSPDYLNHPWGQALHQYAMDQLASYQGQHGGGGGGTPHSPLNIASIVGGQNSPPPPPSGGGLDIGAIVNAPLPGPPPPPPVPGGSGGFGDSNGNTGGFGDSNGDTGGGGFGNAAGGRISRQDGGRSPVPEWLIRQQKEAQDADAPLHGQEFHNPFSPLVAGAEASGIPGIVRGVNKARDSDLPAMERIAGGANAAMSALPYSTTTRLGSALMGTMPRTIGTMTALGLPDLANAFTGQAKAAEKPQAPRPPALMKQIQTRLKAKGIYEGNVDGIDGPVTRDAEEREKQDAIDAKEKAERELRLREIGAGEKKSAAEEATAKTDSERLAAEKADKEKHAAGLEKAEKARKADWLTPLLQFGAPIGGALIGGALGKYGFSGPISNRVEASRRAAQERADEFISGAGNQTRDMAARVNQFYTEGGGSDPFKIAKTKTGWVSPVANKNVAPASTLYPKPSNAGEWAASAGFALPGAGEAAWAWHNYNNAVDEEREAQKALDTKADEASILRLQDAKRQVAKWDALRLLGVGEAVGTLGNTFAKTRTRPDFRPDVHAAENMRAKVGQNIQAEQQKAKAAAAAANPPPAPAKPQPKPKKPPNGGVTPLIPLATLPGSLGQREQVGEEPNALPNSEEGFNRGGIVGQAMRIAKQNGGGTRLAMNDTPAGARMPPDSYINDANNNDDALNRAREFTGPSQREPEFTPLQQHDMGLTPRQELFLRDLWSYRRSLEREPRIAKQNGGAVVHAGPIQHAADGGRTDTVPLDVAAGSYVIPADIISGLGQGDTSAGYRALSGMFGPQQPKPAQGAGGPPVPILAAGGEFVISPDVVAKVGKGDLKSGHEALDLWVKMQRRKNIQALKKLPGPAKD